MDEDFEVSFGLRPDGGDVVEGELAGQDDAGRAKRRCELDRRGVGARHLRRGVNGEAGGDRLDEPGDAEVLDDDRIDARLGAEADGRFDARELVVEDERVERDVALGPALMEIPKGFTERVPVEVRRAGARVEPVQSEVDGVRTRLDCGAQRGEVAGGGEDFGATGGHAGVEAPV